MIGLRYGAGLAAAMLLLLLPTNAGALNIPLQSGYSPRIAVLGLGGVERLRAEIGRLLSAAGATIVADGLADAAAKGVGYDGSLNPTRDDVRRLASAIGTEVVVLGTSSVVERESADPGCRWDAFAGVFLVDGRSGRLLRYRGLSFLAESREAAEARLISAVADEVATWVDVVRSDGSETTGEWKSGDVTFVDFVSRPEGSPGLVPPRFFSRPVPAYTPDADRVHATATVELLVEFLADGSYGRIDVMRWAGFGLDESSILAVRSSKFWPARRDGVSVPARAMLRFNFRFRGDEPIERGRGGR